MRTSRMIAIAAIACAAAVGVIESVCSYVGRAVGAVFHHGIDAIAAHLPASADAKVEASARPRLALVSARAFWHRLIKRERPIVMPQWRMCPSL